MLQLHFANRFETLADELVARLGAEARAGTVLAPAQVIVPGAAIQRRLTLALAQGHGVCANVSFSFLARWLWEQIVRLVPGVAPLSPFEPGVLAWRVLAAFEDTAWATAQPRLADWLRGADPVMRHELAVHVAALFDQYLAYRPDWLEAWAEGALVPLAGADAGARRASGAASSARRSARIRRHACTRRRAFCRPWRPRPRAHACHAPPTSSACRPCLRSTWSACASSGATSTCTSTR